MVVLQQSYTTGQQAFVVAVILVLVVLATLARLRLHRRGLSKPDREHIQAVLGHQITSSPAATRLSGQAIRDGDVDITGRVADLLDRAADGDRGQSVRPARLALAEAWGEVTSDIPRRARQLGQLAVLALVFAPMAVSTAAIVRALSVEPGRPSPATVIGEAQTLLSTLIETVTTTLGQFPFAGFLWSLGFAATILTIEWLYAHWWLVVAALVLAAVGIWRLDDVDGVGGGGYLPPHARAAHILGRLGYLWLAGTVPTVLGRALGIELVGSVIGLVLVLMVGIYIATVTVGRYRDRLLRGDSGRPQLRSLGYRLARSASSLLIVATVPMVGLWIGAAMLSGAPLTIWDAIASADPLVQTGVLVGLVAVGAGLAVLLDDAWEDVRDRLLETAIRSRVRAVLWASGLPLLVGALLFAGLTEFASLPIAAGVALSMTVILRALGGLLQQARYTVALLDADTDRAPSVFIEVWVCEDGDGQVQYIARVSGTDLAHTDREAFVDAVAQAARETATDGAVQPTLAREYYERLTGQGITDIEECRAGVREAVEKALYFHLRDGDGDRRAVRREWLDEQLDAYPQPIVDDVLQTHARRGTISVDADVVELRTDPRRVATDTRHGARRVTV